MFFFFFFFFLFLFLHFFISSKDDFHVDAERMIAKTWEASKIICVDSYLVARNIFRRDIYRSHPTIKVAQYYFFTRDIRRDMIFLRSARIFAGFPKFRTL